jgi:hypothetical protein
MRATAFVDWSLHLTADLVGRFSYKTELKQVLCQTEWMSAGDCWTAKNFSTVEFGDWKKFEDCTPTADWRNVRCPVLGAS